MATIVSIRDIRWYIDGIWIPNNQLVAPHNKYTVGYCNPYENVAVLSMSMRICKIDGWQDIIQLMIGFLCHLARERGFYIYPTINRNKKTQQYTTYWILQFMWECGRRINICADRWVEKILQYSWTYVLPSIQCLR